MNLSNMYTLYNDPPVPGNGLLDQIFDAETGELKDATSTHEIMTPQQLKLVQEMLKFAQGKQTYQGIKSSLMWEEDHSSWDKLHEESQPPAFETETPERSQEKYQVFADLVPIEELVVRSIQGIEQTGEDGTRFEYKIEGEWFWARTTNVESMKRFAAKTKDYPHVAKRVFERLNNIY